MINFWATYCPPCVEEMPSMQRLLESFSNKPFVILAINMGEDRERVNLFLERIGARFDYALLLDPSMEVAADYKVSALPTTLLVDRQGKHAFGGVGARDWNSAAARQQILALFED
jgi:thiol-disulfide isomerase/thioredoxin